MGRGVEPFALRPPPAQAQPIGSIDLLMPKKTHRRSRASSLRLGGPLELLGGPIAQRRMQAAAVVVALDEVFDVRAQVIESATSVSRAGRSGRDGTSDLCSEAEASATEA